MKHCATFLILAFLSLGLWAQSVPIKLMNYNLMYYKAPSTPCNHSRSGAQRDSDLKTIVQYVQPDILSVVEMGSNPINPPVITSSILNTDGVNHYQSANFTSSPFSSLANMLFYNDEKLALHSQSTVDMDPSNVPLIRLVDFYRLYVKDGGHGQAGVDTTWLTVGLVHFKAGSSSSDRTEREKAARAIMRHIENQVGDANVVLTGDFNMRSSSESAYQTMVNYSNATARLEDPIQRSGNWNNNSNFATEHTQSTHSSSRGCFAGGGMDDRFDQFLVSSPIMSGNADLPYQRYNALGQDGGSFNGPLNRSTNFEVNSTIANALYNFSDHLPVIMEVNAQVSGIGLRDYQYLEQNLEVVNPFSERLKLRLPEGPRRPLQVRVHNLAGQKILQAPWSAGPYQQNWSIDTQGLAEGIYLLRLEQANGAIITRKIIKRG